MLPDNPVDPSVESAIYNDPYYGLSNTANYPHWQTLQNTNVNITEVNKKLAFQAELRTYFGLNVPQI